MRPNNGKCGGAAAQGVGACLHERDDEGGWQARMKMEQERDGDEWPAGAREHRKESDGRAEQCREARGQRGRLLGLDDG